MFDSKPLTLHRFLKPLTTLVQHLPIPTFGSRTASLVVLWLIVLLVMTNLIYGVAIYAMLKHELRSARPVNPEPASLIEWLSTVED